MSLREFIEKHGVKSILCCFSGGRDSLVSTHYTLVTLKDLDLEKYVCFVDTTVMPPCIYPYVNMVFERIFKPLGGECHILKPEKSFWELAREWGVPQKNRRYCCYHLKLKPLYDFTSHLKPRVAHILGLRKTESMRRINFKFAYWDQKHKIWKLNPILEWNDQDVERYIRENNLPISPHYKMGIQETCICGAFTTKKTLEAIRAHYPELLEKFASLEGEFRNKGSAFYIGKRIYAKELLKQKTLDETLKH
ncbi:MAG: phosphoadenosine phosphosulfate reductase family protein [archaeon YNP-LCB-003-016]|uniref:phosphoadenosine phosphosulfate reductase family protein n=1 Tax=Candidatus Culexarchaeum yellowstonense TaxID=2928963 RepID=UPI0026F320AF|nr:phosphoadenosine phosphosulfate reductase family protein [Candidatus Culexarchaeum yellowstonense]MCR6691598.1 phosphoadenosine phosphosulfate reductase family protein [Candidatus Culexarchaeum yellowstonense]